MARRLHSREKRFVGSVGAMFRLTLGSLESLIEHLRQAENQRLAGPKPDVDALMAPLSAGARALFTIMRNNAVRGSERAVFSAGDGRAEAQRMARDMGPDGMRRVANELQAFIRDKRLHPHEMWPEWKGDLRELDCAWDGIHGWEA